MTSIPKKILVNCSCRALNTIQKYGYFGDYDSWEDASKKCRGYADDLILNKVIEGTEMVKRGDAVYERDSVCFNTHDIEHHLMYYILTSTYHSKGEKIIVDWGGALGSAYFQHKDILDTYLVDYKWIVVEQENYVSYGKNHLEDGHLCFINFNHPQLTEILSSKPIDIVIVRSSLQYIPAYKDVAIAIIQQKPHIILVDRIPIAKRPRICIQKVPPSIYDAEYPIRFFSEEELLDLFKPYILVEKFHTKIDGITVLPDEFVHNWCYVFRNDGI